MTGIAKFRHLVGISLAMWAYVDDFPSPPMAMPDIAIDAGTSLNATSRGESEPSMGHESMLDNRTKLPPNGCRASRRDDDSERTAVDTPSINDTADNTPTMGGRGSRPMMQAGGARTGARRDAGLMSGGVAMGPADEADNRRIDDRVIMDDAIVDDADVAVDAPDMNMADAAPWIPRLPICPTSTRPSMYSGHGGRPTDVHSHQRSPSIRNVCQRGMSLHWRRMRRGLQSRPLRHTMWSRHR